MSATEQDLFGSSLGSSTRGSLVLKPDEPVGKLRTEEEYRAERLRRFKAAWCTGTPPAWPYCHLWEEAKEKARQAMLADEQHDAHMQNLADFNHMKWLEFLDEKQAKRERYR